MHLPVRAWRKAREHLAVDMSMPRATARAVLTADGVTTRALTKDRGRNMTLAAATMAAGLAVDLGATRIPTDNFQATEHPLAPATTGRDSATPLRWLLPVSRLDGENLQVLLAASR